MVSPSKQQFANAPHEFTVVRRLKPKYFLDSYRSLWPNIANANLESNWAFVEFVA